jgi:hypothetical protein
MTIWDRQGHQLTKEYELQRSIPKWMGTGVRPPIVIAPNIRGYYEGARLNDNGLWNIYLDNGEVIRNVDMLKNLKIQDVLALMSGLGTIFCNKTVDGYELPWREMGDDFVTTDILMTQRDMYKSEAESYKERLTGREGSTEDTLRTEQRFEAVGRASKKGMGHPMIWGRREASERLSPEQDDIMGQFDTMQGEGGL